MLSAGLSKGILAFPNLASYFLDDLCVLDGMLPVWQNVVAPLPESGPALPESTPGLVLT